MRMLAIATLLTVCWSPLTLLFPDEPGTCPPGPKKEALARDWDALPVPANPGYGYEWQLIDTFSDSFTYTDKDAAFRAKWNDTYWNDWTGPGLTHWESDESRFDGEHLVIAASRREGTDKVNCGVVTSKTPILYPIYSEARIKVSNLELSSNFWFLSTDDKREIDVLEVYGGSPDEWTAGHMSTNFHVFIRDTLGKAIYSDFADHNHVATLDGSKWRDDFHTFGVAWMSPTDITLYIDGKKLPDGSWAQAEMFDKGNTETFMDKEQYRIDRPMYMIIDTEDHAWRSRQGIVADDDSLADPDRNRMLVDWVRTYRLVPSTGK